MTLRASMVSASNLIFATPHGSVLYGLNHQHSDRDMMYVYSTGQRAHQRVNGDDDFVTVGLGYFLDLAQGGAHQYLESLFSPVKEWYDESYRPMIENMVVPAALVRAKYLRTIKHFAYGDTVKRRRHALRLALALHDLALHGRFNPRLGPITAQGITRMAESMSPDELYKGAMEYATSRSGWSMT